MGRRGYLLTTWLFLALVGVLVLAGEHSPAEVSTGPPPSLSSTGSGDRLPPFPPLGLDRRLSAISPLVQVIYGDEAVMERNASEVASHHLLLSGGVAEIGWAIYRIGGLAYGGYPQAISLELGGATQPWAEVDLAVGDFTHQRWAFYGPLNPEELSSGQVALDQFSLTPEDVVSPNGNAFLLVVARPGAAVEIARVRVELKEVPARIGTYNIEWLERPGMRGGYERSEEDFYELARIIASDYGFDLVGIAEVVDQESLNRLLTYLPGYDAVFIASGRESQHLALIYRTGRVEIINAYEEDAIRIGNPFLRPGLVVEARIGNFDFKLMMVHLKALFDSSSKAKRLQQAQEINSWLDQQFADPSGERDFIVLGDMNDFLGSPPLEEIRLEGRAERMHFLTEELEPGDYSTPEYESTVDHIAVSADYTYSPPGGPEREYISGSVDILPLVDIYPNYILRLSDHQPVVAAFRVAVDDD